MKICCGTWQEEARRKKPLIQPTSSRKSSIINGKETQMKKGNKNTPMNLQKEIISISSDNSFSSCWKK